MSPTLAQVWRILTSHCKEITHSWRTWRLRKMRNQKTRSLSIEQAMYRMTNRNMSFLTQQTSKKCYANIQKHMFSIEAQVITQR